MQKPLSLRSFVVVTATFRLVYVLVIMEVGSRRILHCNVTRHPTAEWTLQQFRECVTGEEGYRFVIHDPRQHLLQRFGFIPTSPRFENIENALQVTTSERFL
jgi:hypothetical protein